MASSSFSPLLIILPKTENDNDTIIKNDTLFIEGLYAKETPISNITYINGNAIVPPIEMKTNGISFGALNVGHFRTKDQKDILLYLHSDETNVTHIKTSNNEGVFINFKDPAKSAGFSNKLKGGISSSAYPIQLTLSIKKAPSSKNVCQPWLLLQSVCILTTDCRSVSRRHGWRLPTTRLVSGINTSAGYQLSSLP